jgi:hypothetical protein
MPRLYLTSAELKESVLGFSMAGPIGALTAAALDKLLFRASERVDGFCKRRIQTIGSTTISGASTITAGSTSLPVVSTLTFDNKDEQAVTIGTGGSQETVLIQSGGVSITAYTSPYPGTLTLDTPTQFNHAVGEAVVGIYKEVTEAGGVSSGDSFSESILTQQAQIAQAHQPAINLRNLTRVVWLRNSPIISISGIEHAYSFLNSYQAVTGNIMIPNAHDGWYRFSSGIVITPEGLMRTTYLGGYLVAPDDVKQATMYYAADLLQQFINPGMAIETRQGKVAFKYATGNRPKSPNVEAAEGILKDGKYRRIV